MPYIESSTIAENLKKQSLVAAVLIIISLTSSVQTAAFGELCNSDSDCTDANQECVKYLSCGTGTCQCISGYGNSNNTGCGYLLRSYGETCGSNSYCNGANQECSSTTNQCECSMWYTYHTVPQACVTVELKILTESCGGWWNEQCLVVDSEGGECDTTSTCSCKSGYHASSTISCRAPLHGEFCEWSPSCTLALEPSTINADDLSVHSPTCNDNQCQCPPSSDTRVVLGNTICLVPTSDALLDNGEECTHFHQCQSSLCVKCVNATTGICMDSTLSKAAQGPDTTVLVVLIAVVFQFAFLHIVLFK